MMQVGDAYLEVDDEVSAKRIVEALNGRLYMDRLVQATVFDSAAYSDLQIN